MKFLNTFKLLLIGFCLIAFALLSKFEDRQVIRDLDFAVTVKVQDAIDRSTRLRLKALTANVLEGSVFFAGPLITSLATVVLTGLAFRKRKLWAFLIPLCFALIVGVELVAKEMVHHPPPSFFMIKNPVSMFPKYHVSEEFSFPSGHAARAVFIGFLISDIGYRIMKKRWILWTGVGIYVFLVSLSKIYLGHHWFSDILAGIFLGSGFGVLTASIVGKYNTSTMSD